VKLVEAQLGEAQYQEFLETNPCFVPGGRSVDGPSGHGPWPHALIRQPKLPGLATRQPDFMWIATDSESTYPVLVELERPDKKWFTLDGRTHSDLNHAVDQLRDWEAWLAKPANVSWLALIPARSRLEPTGSRLRSTSGRHRLSNIDAPVGVSLRQLNGTSHRFVPVASQRPATSGPPRGSATPSPRRVAAR